ncbi:hypothetical protein DFH09DRAFT_1295256 [Mycena vulgaris]|nr:hypothetical protein DFH09DRAFT_1295256 [Mycena vulgaris]
MCAKLSKILVAAIRASSAVRSSELGALVIVTCILSSWRTMNKGVRLSGCRTGTKIKTKRKCSATQDSSPIGTTLGGQTGRPGLEVNRSGSKAVETRKEVDRSGAGTGKTGNRVEVRKGRPEA